MPHQCVKCGSFYDDGAKEILTGCKCKGKLFMFVKDADLKKAEQVTLTLSDDEKEKMENDAMEIAGLDHDKSCETVVLDFESVNMAAPGKFEIDLVNIFKRNPFVLKLGDGKYIIDISQTFNSLKGSKKEDKSEE